MKDPVTENQATNSVASANAGTTSEGVASMSAPPFSIQSGDDDSSLNILSNDGQKNDSAEETAGGMIDDAGGIENLNYLFGANFGEDYQDLLSRMYSYEDEFQTVINIEGLPKAAIDELYMEYSKARTVEELLTNVVFDNAHCEEIDEETAEYANSLLTENVIRMNLVEAIHEFYITIESNKILKMLQGIQGFLIDGIEEIKTQIAALENDLIALRNLLWTARKDFAKAGLETYIDAALAITGITLLACGAMTPGLNAALFLGGLAAGALLAKSDESAVPGLGSVGGAKGSIATANLLSKNIQNLHVVPSSIKDPKLLLQIAGEEGKIAGGYKTVPILNVALSGLDLKNNIDDTIEGKEKMYAVERALMNTIKKIGTKMDSILLIENMLKSMDGFFKNLEKALDANTGKLDGLLEEIRLYNSQLGQ